MVNTFFIPQEKYSELQQLFANSVKDSKPREWKLFYSIAVNLNNEETVNISIYKTSEPIGAFKIGEIYYRGSSNSFFEKNGFTNASSVKRSIDKLIKVKVLFNYKKEYKFANPFFKLWLLKNYT